MTDQRVNQGSVGQWRISRVGQWRVSGSIRGQWVSDRSAEWINDGSVGQSGVSDGSVEWINDGSVGQWWWVWVMQSMSDDSVLYSDCRQSWDINWRNNVQLWHYTNTRTDRQTDRQTDRLTRDDVAVELFTRECDRTTAIIKRRLHKHTDIQTHTRTQNYSHI